MLSKSLVSVDSKRMDSDMLVSLRMAVMDPESRVLYERKETEISNLKSRVSTGIKKNEELVRTKEKCDYLENELESKTLVYEAKVRECMEKIARYASFIILLLNNCLNS